MARNMTRNLGKVIFEIFLLVMGSVAFAYVVGESGDARVVYGAQSYGDSEFVTYLREGLLNWLSGGIVSAQTSQGGMWTCLHDRNGAICQEYPASVCNNVCGSNCFPGARADSSDCKLGTCFDSVNGACNAGTPKLACENSGARWSENTPAQCTRNCCLINPDGQGGADQTKFATQQECNYLGSQLGADVQWNPVNDELECLALARTRTEGACVLDFVAEEDGYNCRFISQRECFEMGGDFYEGKLCTNPELNTICERTEETTCVENKDEVYYVDSCGNVANIYDSTKLNSADYWSRKFTKSESCGLATSNNPLGRQTQCGNCDYLGGSICGEPRNGLDNSPIYGDYVCRDLSCVDEWGDRREQGESWCAFESRIGVDNLNVTNMQRSVDVPGSRHYKRLCFDGEVRTEPCQDGRQEICSEEDDVLGNSYAICRPNNWRACFEANADDESLAECGDTTDCVLYPLRIDYYYRFNMCVPKYPPGFDLRESLNNNSEATSLCGMVGGKNMTCTRIEVKNLLGNWECKANCDCTSEKYTEAMNNLCVSLGDCGAYVNLEGTYTEEGYEISKRGKEIRDEYIANLSQDLGDIEGQKTDPLLNDTFGILFQNKRGGLSTLAARMRTNLWGVTLGISRSTNLGTMFIDFIITMWTHWLSFAYSNIIGAGAVRRIPVEFTCLPWQPPAGGADCAKCADYEYGCSEYKCESLGQTCALINEGTSNELCADLNPNDASAPVINVNESAIGAGFNYLDARQNIGVRIKANEGDGCIKEYTPVKFGLVLNEPGQCKVSEVHTAGYDEMNEFLGGNNYYVYNHEDVSAMPTLSELGVSGVDPARRGDYNLYVRCKDNAGNPNAAEYVVNFCVRPADDRTAPLINEFSPSSPGYAGLAASNFTLRFFTNEPAECKWSSEDKDYSLMENYILCNDDISQVELNGWVCSALLPVGQNERTNYYFRCLDQPWLENSTSRNVNSQSMTYVIEKTRSALTISSVSPNEQTISVGSEPVSVNIELRTSGGLNNGNSICEYRFGGSGISSRFFNTDGNVHRQRFSTLLAGSYNLEFMCRDLAGNTANANSQFSIEVDNEGPLITRVYNAGNNLNVVTNEPSECGYSFTGCGFELANATMMSGASYVHTTTLNQGLSYNIKCEDGFGNAGSCLVVRGGY